MLCNRKSGLTKTKTINKIGLNSNNKIIFFIAFLFVLRLQISVRSKCKMITKLIDCYRILPHFLLNNLYYFTPFNSNLYVILTQILIFRHIKVKIEYFFNNFE